jgi:hypothetical protein
VYRHVSSIRYVRLFPPSLQWVSRICPGIPHLRRYYGFISLLSSPLQGSLWFPSTACYPPPDACLFRRPVHLYRPRPGLLCQVNHTRFRRRRLGDLPSSWRSPVIACPGLETPAAPNNLALAVVQILPSAIGRASASATMSDFGAESSRPTISLSTLPPASHPARGKTRFRPVRYDFDRAGLSPAGFVSKGFIRSSGILLPQA